jgi:amidophosphoribosyltransferase
MAGICGVVKKEGDCVKDLFWGTFYLQHRAQNYCGMALSHNENLGEPRTHGGLLKQEFPKASLDRMSGDAGVGCVSAGRMPISELSRAGGAIYCFDGNIINHDSLKNSLLNKGESFSGYKKPQDVEDIALLGKIISGEPNFEKGVERFAETMHGDFAVIALTKDGIYAARGWGRKPLIMGENETGYAVSSESNSFVNTGFNIARDVKPGEIVLLNKEGIRTIKQLDLTPIRFGTFEWIYTSHPASTIDGRNVTNVRRNIGRALAKRYPVEADLVSPVPNSGRWHAIGYSHGSGINYEEVFIRYDYSDRSYTPGEQSARDEEARTKLIPLEDAIRGKRIVLVDDSIVRGTQLMNRVKELKKFGAKEVHIRAACPPLMHACCYGKTTKKDSDCIAARMSIQEIQKLMGVDSLGYATVSDLEEAIGIPKENLCLECW